MPTENELMQSLFDTIDRIFEKYIAKIEDITVRRDPTPVAAPTPVTPSTRTPSPVVPTPVPKTDEPRTAIKDRDLYQPTWRDIYRWGGLKGLIRSGLRRAGLAKRDPWGKPKPFSQPSVSEYIQFGRNIDLLLEQCFNRVFTINESVDEIQQLIADMKREIRTAITQFFTTHYKDLAEPTTPPKPEDVPPIPEEKPTPRPTKKKVAKKAEPTPRPTKKKVAKKAEPTPRPTKKKVEPTPRPTKKKTAKKAEPTPRPTKKKVEPTPRPTKKKVAKKAEPTPRPTKKKVAKKAEPTPRPTKKKVARPKEQTLWRTPDDASGLTKFGDL